MMGEALTNAAALVPLFTLLGWPVALRRVCKRWRDAYDHYVRSHSKPSSRWHFGTDGILHDYRAGIYPHWMGYILYVVFTEPVMYELPPFERWPICKVGILEEELRGVVHTVRVNAQRRRINIDVSGLCGSGVNNVTIAFCRGIIDVAPLAHCVRNLTLTDCPNVRNFEAAVHSMTQAGTEFRWVQG
jgi:hypothetical protein